jgi:TonB family protein
MIAPMFSSSYFSWVIGYLLNSLWQVPLVFVAAWLVTRLMRQAGPRSEHRVWVSALALEIALPACHFQLSGIWSQISTFLLMLSGVPEFAGSVSVVQGGGGGGRSGLLRLPAVLLGVVLAAYACSLLYFAARLLFGLRQTLLIRRGATTPTAELPRRFVQAGIEIAISPTIAGPSTIGFFRALLLLPPGFLKTVNEQDLDAALAHEGAHIERHDFAKNLLYQFLSLPIAYHPLLWMTHARVVETREMVCDAMAAETLHGRESYAHSLLRLASMMTTRVPARTLHAIGIFDANHFERRIMNLTHGRVEITKAQRILIGALCGVVALGTCASALALRMDVTASATAPTTAPRSVHIRSGDIAGNKISGENPVYPREAKASRKTLDGTVILAATISKEGVIEHLSVKKSLRADYDKSAMDAVRTWHYKPYLLNGDPIEVETTINITYAIKG